MTRLSSISFESIGRGVLLMTTGPLVLVIALLVWTQSVAAQSAPPAPATDIKSPLSPAESLQQMRVAAGFKIELVAAEPETIDPVAIAFDEDGKLWVVEMTDYPNGPVAGEPPKSRIRTLEDRDGDGRFETATIFVDKLLFATGVQPWRGGVIVTLAGEIVFFKDSNGDGQADVRETWFRGFMQENPQLRANHPRFGLDNRIYVANGLRGGTVVAAADKWGRETPAVPISGMDFRFNPLTGEHGAISGHGQFGLSFDDFGNRFVCTNRNPCRHIVLDDRYIKRNPFLAVKDVAADVSPDAANSRLFPISKAWTTSTLHAGQFTAACGVTIYRGDLLPALRGNSFTCDPTGNLVHRDVLEPRGATFASHYAHENSEFLASPDTWFRPVNLAEGPDGALYVVDMYRAVIEHPQFVPDELKKRPDLNFGDDKGRIYRIVPVAPSGSKETVAGRRRDPAKLSQSSTEDLVRLLGHPNTWHAETAARLLLERQDKAAGPLLAAVLKSKSSPAAKARALWGLESLGLLVQETVQESLSDAAPRVREQAVLLSEKWLKESDALREKVTSLADDVDPRLRFQVALSLGELGTDAKIIPPLASIAVRGAADEWSRYAVLSSVAEQPHVLLAALLRAVTSQPATLPTAGAAPAAGGPLHQRVEVLQLLKDVAMLVGSRRKPDEIAAALGTVISARTTASAEAAGGLRIVLAGIDGIGQGLARRGGSLPALLDALPEDQVQLKSALQEVFTEAVRFAQNAAKDAASRQEALAVLQYAGFPSAGEALLHLAKADPLQDIRLKSIDVLATYKDPRIGSLLLADFQKQTPAVRRTILQALLRDTERTRQLLAEIAAKRISVAELDPSRVQALVKHSDPEIRKQAAELLAAALPAERKQVLETYQKSLALSGDAKRGRLIFEKNCVTCHKIGDLGVDVAPDIADSRTKTPAQLLTDILNPNQAIDNNYVSYTLVTTDGKSLTGIVSTETASSITLRQPENKTAIVLRQDVEELRSNGISLMPEGLEKTISVEQMADLISFIKNWRYLDGQVPLAK